MIEEAFYKMRTDSYTIISMSAMAFGVGITLKLISNRQNLAVVLAELLNYPKLPQIGRTFIGVLSNLQKKVAPSNNHP